MPITGGRTAPQAAGRAEVITSRENRWLKLFRAALRGTAPLEDGLVGVEGPRLVAEVLHSGMDTLAVLCSASGERHLADLAARLPASACLLRISDRLFESVAGTQTPQGIAALLRPRSATMDDVLRASAGAPLVVVLVAVQDPGNVGTVLRTAEALGASGAITTAGTAHPWSPKALRASAGSALRLPVVHGAAPAIVLVQLRVAGFKSYAATLRGPDASGRGALLPSEADLAGPAALLIGNEGAGLPPEVERSADATVRIPLAPAVDSLNAAMAATVLLYEAARQRGFARRDETRAHKT